MTENKEFFEFSQRIKIFLINRPNHSDALELYALYKQATIGDVNIKRPSLFNFKEKAKWDAWNQKKGLNQKEAELDYVKLSKKVLGEIIENCHNKVKLIKDIMPQVPVNVIQRDLVITNNVSETLTRLLDGTVFFVNEDQKINNENQIEKNDEENKEDENKNDEKVKKDEMNGNKEKNEKNEKNEKDEKGENKSENKNNIDSSNHTDSINCPSPMSFSTKASVFECDPVQRMKSYQERKQKLLEVARAHYIAKHSLNK